MPKKIVLSLLCFLSTYAQATGDHWFYDTDPERSRQQSSVGAGYNPGQHEFGGGEATQRIAAHQGVQRQFQHEGAGAVPGGRRSADPSSAGPRVRSQTGQRLLACQQ